MEKHKYILEKLSNDELPDEINYHNFPLITVFQELHEAKLVTAIDASDLGGLIYHDPQITLSGREYLAKLNAPPTPPQNPINIGNISGSTFQVGNGNSLSVHVSVQELVENIAKSNDIEAKSKLKELLNNGTVANLIGVGATALLALL